MVHTHIKGKGKLAFFLGFVLFLKNSKGFWFSTFTQGKQTKKNYVKQIRLAN